MELKRNRDCKGERKIQRKKKKDDKIVRKKKQLDTETSRQYDRKKENASETKIHECLGDWPAWGRGFLFYECVSDHILIRAR